MALRRRQYADAAANVFAQPRTSFAQVVIGLWLVLAGAVIGIVAALLTGPTRPDH